MDKPAHPGEQASLSDYLAAERTLLAWIRTGLALMGFGFVVARFGLFLQQLALVRGGEPKQSFGLSLWFGTALIAAGVLVQVLSGIHHLRLVQRLRRGETGMGHSTASAIAVSFFLALVGIGMAVYLVSIKQ